MIKTIAFVVIGILVIIAGLIVAKSPKKIQVSSPITATPAPTTATTGSTAGITPATTPNEAALPPEKEVSLVVSSPTNGSTVTSPSITVKGTTAPKADVYVNDKDAVADAKGNFAIPILLDEGENYLIVTIVDPDGNTAEKEITVTYDAGQ